MTEKKKNGLSFRHLLSNFWQIILLLLMVMVIAVALKKLRTPGYSIQSFQMPKHLSDHGLNGQVFAMRIRDQIDLIKTSVNSSKDDSTTTLNADVRPDLNLEVLGIGFSTDHLLYHIAELFGIEQKTIHGDLTDVDQELRLTLRGQGIPASTISQPYDQTSMSKGLDSLVAKASEKILERIDPYRLAIWHYYRDEKNRAMEIIRNMIKQNHEDMAWAHFAWGIFIKNEDLDEAIFHYQKAIEIDPQLKTAYNNLGWIFFQKGMFAEAIESFENARAIESGFGLNNGLALSYTRIGEIDMAEAAYRRNLTEYPEVLWSYGNYAEFLVGHYQDTVGASQLFKEAGNHIPENADYYSAIAAHYIIADKKDSAQLMLRRALDYDPQNVVSLQAISNLHSILEEHQLVEHYLRRYITELRRQRYEKGMLQNALNRLTMNDYRLEKYDSALVHAQEAIDVDPTMGYPYSTLAETYAFMGQKQLFYDAIEKAVSRGFQLASFQDQAPYKQYQHEDRFKQLLMKKWKG